MGNQADRPSRLIFVKHGKPVIAADLPRSKWTLSPEGSDRAQALAARLAAFEPKALFASPEPKAYDTALAMADLWGLSVTADPGFAEHRADENPFVSPPEIEALILDALRRPDDLVMGEETGAAARSRFHDAVARAAASVAGTKVIAAHGRVITFWLSARLGFDPVSFWRRLGFTSAAVLSEDGARFEIVDP